MFRRISKIYGMAVLLFVLTANYTLAHSPHDPIISVAISPKFEKDQMVFAIVSNTLMISSDAGCSWKKLANGLDYGNQLSSLAVSPTFDRDRTIFVTSKGDGIYRSEDGGKSWEKMNSGLADRDIISIHLSPLYSSTQTVLAIDAKGKLFISQNKGKNWRHRSVQGLIANCLFFLSEMEKETIMVGTVDGKLLLSDDEGMSWQQMFQHPDCGSITCLYAPQFSNANKTILAGTEKCGVLMIELETGQLQLLGAGLKEKFITSLWAETLNKELRIYVSSDEGFFHYNFKEDKWENQSKGLTTDQQAKEPAFLSPNFKEIAVNGDLLFLGGYDGLFKSSDGGRNWRQLDTLSPGIITGLSVSTAKEEGSNEVALATYGGGAYLYGSGKQSWKVINNGLSWTRLNDIAFSPKYINDGIIFSGSERNFLVFESINNNWQRVHVSFSFRNRIINKLKYYFKKLGISNSTIKNIFGYKRGDAQFPTSVVPSPAIDNDGTVYFGTRGNGIYRSKDLGQTNSMIWDSENGIVTSLCISPKFTIDGTLFAGILDLGVYKSTDKGSSWERIATNIPATGDIYLFISPNFEKDKTVVLGNGSGLFLSTDGGSNWKRIGKEAMKGPISCVSISPDYAADGIIIAGVTGRGLWISSDRGINFHSFGEQLIQNNYQAKYFKFSSNFRSDSTMYCASELELFRSTDKGKTWELLYRPLRFEDFREEIRYEGIWNKKSNNGCSALTETYSNTKGSRAKLNFYGTGIKWIGSKTSEHGNADIFIDGQFEGKISQKLDNLKNKENCIIFKKNGLEKRSHEIIIEVVCNDKQEACGWVSIDALESNFGETIAVEIQSR